MKNDFRAHLSMLDDDDLADVTTAVAREKARRSQRPPSEMQPAEFERWAADQIKQAEAARKVAEDAEG
jgi:hypothetical protein